MNLDLDSILALCEAYGDCLLWQGPLMNGSPQVFNGGRYFQARRLVFEACKCKAIPAGRHPVMKCREARCLNHEHMALMTHKEIGALAAKEGKFASPQRRAAIAAGHIRAGHTKLTAEQAREIRLSEESGPALAAKHGINRSLVNRIKRGEAWRETTQGASIFNL